MPKSSAWGIPYEIRPSKQVERRLVMETISLSQYAGVDVSKLPFVGMGGTKYIDFTLAHKMLGVKRFTSIEHDETLWARCDFNKPFNSINLFEGPAADFLAEVGFPEPAIVWFDLEKMASKDARDDIVGAATSIKPGSFLFVTATAEMPEELLNLKMIQRLANLKARFEPLADRLQEGWMNKKDFHLASARLAKAFCSYGFGGRSDGTFFPLVYLSYRDSNWMTTVGGYFGPGDVGRKIIKIVRHRHKFLLGSEELPFVLEQFNITDIERILFDRAMTENPRKRKSKKQLKELGFRSSIVAQYVDLARFIPRFVETAP
jgi:hypothetical protein